MLFVGNSLLMIDHELSLAQGQVLFWRAPWADGGLTDLAGHDRHIFGRPYFSVPLANLDRFLDAWNALPDARFGEYLEALPASWVYDKAKLLEILSYLMDVKRNIHTIAANAIKVFS